ncbi:unnamed protein product [Paramecium octaurelia]|uniref:Uncharacterized protein n=1 Tax=Paramecium octaurelia TaxID=43137 RepID=A0A8S1YIZ8_PAROT|nr:unnamed protein product [Paramecium octaurelia]
MFESSVDSEFKGPIPPLLSSRVGFQEGDLQQYSLSSFHQQIPMSLVRQKTFGIKKSENQSVYDNEEIQYGSKPQFLKTIIAKSLQSNFINNLWNRSYLRKLNQLSFFQIQQLDDLQIVSDGNEYNRAPQLWIMVDVFTPFSKFIAFWDAFQIITYLLIFFWLPYKISFDIYHISELFSETKNAIIEYMLMIILALDIGVGMNLAFIEKGQLIKDRKRIIVNYFNKNAFVDLVTICIYLCGFLFHSDSPIFCTKSEFQRLHHDLHPVNSLRCLLYIEDNQNKQDLSSNLRVFQSKRLPE